LALRVEMIYDKGKYREYFERLAAETGLRVAGEITPAYSLLDRRGFQAIRRIFPNAKVIFLIRDPVERYISHLKFEETRLGHDAFPAAEKVLACLDDPHMFLRSDYKRTLEELGRVFDKEKIHIEFFEHLMGKDTHAAALRGITDFLEIDFIHGDIEKKHNESIPIEIDMDNIPTVASRFGHVYEFIRQSMPNQLPDNWERNYALAREPRQADKKARL
jgi:hypothetical protein